MSESDREYVMVMGGFFLFFYFVLPLVAIGMEKLACSVRDVPVVQWVLVCNKD